MHRVAEGKKIGIKEIAKKGGVSATAVSLVLNDRPGVSPETRQRIQEIIAEVGYEARHSNGSSGRRATRRNSANSIAFLAFGESTIPSDAYYASMLSGVTFRAHELGLQLRSTTVEAEEVNLANIGLDEINGLLVTGRPSKAFISAVREAETPYVLISCSRARFPGDSVRAENTDSSFRAVRHLIELGHRNIAFIGGEKSNPEAWERYTGYLEALDAFNIPFDRRLVAFSSFAPDRNQEGFAKLLSREVDFSAVFASNDYLAIGVYHLAHERGIQIPNDLSVVGFDDIETAQFLRPQLTTVQTDQAGLGRAAINRLVQIIEQPDPPINIRTQTNLIIRKSTSSPT